jgi:hypothetical protein
MKRLALFLGSLIFLVSSFVYAGVDYGLELGVRQQSGSATGFLTSTNSQTAFQFGGIVQFPIGGPVNLRTGMLYTQRPLQVSNPNMPTTKVSLNYLDLPIDFMFNFAEYAGFFVGANLALNLDHSCDSAGCSVTNVSSTILPFTFGASFKFAPQVGMTIYYDSYYNTMANLSTPSYNLSVGNYQAVGINFLFSFN